MKEVAIIVDLNSIRLIVPEDKAGNIAYIEAEARQLMIDRCMAWGRGDNIVEGFEEDYEQSDITENTGE